ncbi:MAG: nucleotidyltransferase domain-containing protein [Deltaproteobacteria bacterium]|nr:nucleotidyltransferase domain-containing protein [Deltaproteobacteria bacterium]
MALKKNGFSSMTELAKNLGIHRNTISYYLGEQSVIPEKLELILNRLNLNLNDVVIKVKTESKNNLEIMAPLIDALLNKHPECCLVLFGSRTTKSFGNYSDWDIGIFSKKKFPHAQYRTLLKLKSEFTESLPYFVDLVNLNNADPPFLENIKDNMVFLAGKFSDWLSLKEKCHEQKIN